MSSSPKHKEKSKANISNYTIINSDEENLLGVTIDNHLKSELHIKHLSSKAGQKLYALSRVSLYMSLSQRRMIMQLFIIVSAWLLSINMNEPQPKYKQ